MRSIVIELGFLETKSLYCFRCSATWNIFKIKRGVSVGSVTNLYPPVYIHQLLTQLASLGFSEKPLGTQQSPFSSLYALSVSK